MTPYLTFGIADRFMNRNEKYYPVVLIVLWLLVHLLLAWHYGIRNLFDTNLYIREADFLWQQGSLADRDHSFYIIPIAIISFFRGLFPGQIIPFLIFQCLLSGLAMLSLYASSAKIFKSKLAGLITGFIFLLWWDNIHWNTTAMTESLACSVTCFVIYALTFFCNTRKDYWLTGILLVISFFIRPTGIITIVGAIVFMLGYHWETLKTRTALKVIIISSFFFIGLAGAIIMFSRWDFTDQLKRGNIITYMDTIEGSALYQESMRVESAHIESGDQNGHPILKIASYIFHNPFHFLKAAFFKVLYLLSFYRPYYTTLHNIYSISWALFVYMLCYIGFRNTEEPIRLFTITVIVVNCILIAVATVDWDNRFFIPMEPGIVLLAGGGGMYVWKWLNSRITLKQRIE